MYYVHTHASWHESLRRVGPLHASFSKSAPAKSHVEAVDRFHTASARLPCLPAPFISLRIRTQTQGREMGPPPMSLDEWDPEAVGSTSHRHRHRPSPIGALLDSEMAEAEAEAERVAGMPGTNDRLMVSVTNDGHTTQGIPQMPDARCPSDTAT
ncbi:hypothetical protein LZ30DRAFT_725355 [Colletotrichum cereale]|nr:hypothetical protein LZ30DRAFT_725355 [Colletotrichum cereale]